jgi:hypothetical protein
MGRFHVASANRSIPLGEQKEKAFVAKPGHECQERLSRPVNRDDTLIHESWIRDRLRIRFESSSCWVSHSTTLVQSNRI